MLFDLIQTWEGPSDVEQAFNMLLASIQEDFRYGPTEYMKVSYAWV